MTKQSATAFAPATVANVAVGFDILGFSIAGVGDEVTVSISPNNKEVEIQEISGLVTTLPKDSKKNTASVGLKKMIDDLRLDHGFTIKIKKGIALSSGMGGSAASAVGAVVAANALLKTPVSQSKLLEFALAGEAVASGAIHGDNVGPCLLGGLTLISPTMEMTSIPVPAQIYSVLVHPDIEIETRQARSILKSEIFLAQYVQQSSWLAGFLAGCFKGDLGLIQRSMNDVVIEPQRSRLIPHFGELKKCAIDLGVLGFSISGSGPSVFAWARSEKEAAQVKEALLQIFTKYGISAQGWVSPVQSPGARIIS